MTVLQQQSDALMVSLKAPLVPVVQMVLPPYKVGQPVPARVPAVFWMLPPSTGGV